MALVSVIRWRPFWQQSLIREVERRTGLSQNTIRKYLRAGRSPRAFRQRADGIGRDA